jgi:hypothetical protein
LLKLQGKFANTELSSVTATAVHGTSKCMRSYACHHGTIMLPCRLHGPFPDKHNSLGHRSLATDARSHANTTRARSASQRNFESCTVRSQNLKPLLYMHLVVTQSNPAVFQMHDTNNRTLCGKTIARPHSMHLRKFTGTLHSTGLQIARCCSIECHT